MIYLKKIIFTLILLAGFVSIGYSQLPNQNAYLLKSIDSYSSYSACWGYAAPDGREYALLGAFEGTSFVDITDSANIHEVDFVPTSSTSSTNSGNGWREMKVYSHYAYIVSEATNSRLQIVDLQYLPDSVHVVGVYNFTGYNHTHAIQQAGHFLYIMGGSSTPGGGSNGGVTILDLTNPEVPVKRGSWSTRYVHDARVKNDTIWAMNINNSDGEITVINASDKDNPVEITNWLNLPNPSPHNCDLTMDSKYLLATDEVGSTPRLLKIWNIQNIFSTTLATTWQPTGITGSRVHNVEIYGDYAVIAHYSAGIRVVDISNPLTPTEVAWFDTDTASNSSSYRGTWGVFKFPSGKIIGSDMSRGLYVVKTTISALTEVTNNSSNIPHEYKLSQNYPNPFNPSTKISYSIPKNSFVSIKVFDMLGREVATLLNENKPAGEFEINFNSSKFNLSSGIYLYKINAGEFSDTKKMILIK